VLLRTKELLDVFFFEAIDAFDIHKSADDHRDFSSFLQNPRNLRWLEQVGASRN